MRMRIQLFFVPIKMMRDMWCLNFFQKTNESYLSLHLNKLHTNRVEYTNGKGKEKSQFYVYFVRFTIFDILLFILCLNGKWIKGTACCPVAKNFNIIFFFILLFFCSIRCFFLWVNRSFVGFNRCYCQQKSWTIQFVWAHN